MFYVDIQHVQLTLVEKIVDLNLKFGIPPHLCGYHGYHATIGLTFSRCALLLSKMKELNLYIAFFKPCILVKCH